MSKHRSVARGLSFLCLALLLLSLIIRFWASDRAWEKSGPTHITVVGETVYLFAAGELYQLNRDGELLARHAAAVTGLSDVPIDIRPGGNGALLIAEQRPARLRSCDTQSWDCQAIEWGPADPPGRQFKVLWSETDGRVLVTDARADSLSSIAVAEAAVEVLVPDGVLAGPNDLAFDPQGHLWVADTDHRRIVELIPGEGGLFETGREHSAVNRLTVDERHFPMMLALAGDGNWWVTQSAEFSDRYADLVVYDPDEGAVARVELPGGVYATDVAAAGPELLVTDLEQFAVYRVDSRTHEVSSFGDARFTAAMTGFRENKERYQRISALALGATVLFGLLMVTAAFFATPRDKRWTEQSGLIKAVESAGSVPGSGAVHWLQRKPGFDRAIRWAGLAGIVILILCVAGGFALYAWVLHSAGAEPDDDLQARLDALGLILLLCGILFAGTIPLLRQVLRAMKHRIGTDGRQLYIRLDDGRELVVPAAELAYTNAAVLYRQYALPVLSGRGQSLYQAGEVEDWLAPLLAPANALNALQGLKHQWRHRNALLMWSLGLTGAMFLVLSALAYLGMV
jgi:hypothetical protein